MNSYNCKFLIILFIFISSVNAQSYDDASEASKLCLLAQGSIGNNFTNDRDADISLEKILSVIGASKRFILQPCSDINNAVATSYKGLRYILYDKSFMSTIANNSTAWSQLFILAHEVGHHINGHSIDILLAAADVVEPKTLSAKRQQELESDEFAGFILAKLGATLEQTSEAIKLLSSNKDDTYSSHPTKAKRLNAIKIGFNKALEKEQVVYEKKTDLNTSDEYFYRGYDKSDKGDYYGAISDFTKAIEINPNVASYYNGSASAKYELKNYYGAISDIIKAIEINPNDAIYYNNRANVKYALKDYYGAISDITKAIEINPNLEGAYNKKGVYKSELKDYNGAILDYTKAIEINPNKENYYRNRAVAKNQLKDHYGAISDFTKAIEINPSKDYSYYKGRGAAKYELDDYYGAISDYNKAIEISPNEGSSYIARAISKYLINDFYGACQDANKAQELGSDATRIINIVCK